jgi:hypothetical protein
VRQTAPVLGAKIGPYLQDSEWQVGASFRTFRSDVQYQGTRPSQPVTKLGTGVISKLQLLDLSGTYGIDEQLNLTLNVPIVLYGSSSRALPSSVEGSPRFVQSTKGLGDMTVLARRWLLDTRKHLRGNVALGVGLKAPTGNSNSMDSFPAGNGQNIRLRGVDPSIQLGDGGWGAILDIQAFQQVGDFTFFLAGGYLFNPRDETRTLSPPAFLNPNGPKAVLRFQRFLTVADQYFGRVGVTHPVPGVKGLSLLLAARIEGVPVNDVFGESVGFRRPGYTIAFEPGLIYSLKGGTTLAFSVPITTQRNVQEQLPGVPRDSTFPEFVVLASVTHRFGKGK